MSAPQHMENEAVGTARSGVAQAPNPDSLELAPGTVHEGLQGWVPELAGDEDLRVALEKAFDYRGDVTLTKKDGTKLEGYIFDRVSGEKLGNSFVRLLLKDSHQRVKVGFDEVGGLAFSGRDPAAGKSWEAWVSKYWQLKAAGATEIAQHPDTGE